MVEYYGCFALQPFWVQNKSTSSYSKIEIAAMHYSASIDDINILECILYRYMHNYIANVWIYMFYLTNIIYHV